jgi:hypothetical protein
MIRASDLLRAAALLPLLCPATEGGPQAPRFESAAQLTPTTIKAYRALARTHAGATVSAESESRYLFELGSGVILPLLGVLETEIVPGVDADVPPSAQGSAKSLEVQQEDVIVAALAKFGRKPVVQAMTRELAKTSSVRFRADCLRLLSAVGDRDDLRLICQIASPAGENADLDPTLAPVLVDAATSIFSRDFGALFAVGDLWRGIPSATRLCLYQALGAVASPVSVSILGLRLGRQAAEDPFVLADLSRASKRVPLPVESSVLELVRPYLLSEQTVLVQSAAICLGGFQDEKSIAGLIQLLSHSDAGVRGAAHQALCSIAGVGLWPDVSRWTSWYEGERMWCAVDAPSRIQEIRNGDAGERAHAIAELSEHPLYRKDMALELQNVLPHEPDEIRILGIRALGQLGAATSVPFLESCMLDPAPDLAAEARAALGRIQAQRDHPCGGVP